MPNKIVKLESFHCQPQLLLSALINRETFNAFQCNFIIPRIWCTLVRNWELETFGTYWRVLLSSTSAECKWAHFCSRWQKWIGLSHHYLPSWICGLSWCAATLTNRWQAHTLWFCDPYASLQIQVTWPFYCQPPFLLLTTFATPWWNPTPGDYW